MNFRSSTVIVFVAITVFVFTSVLLNSCEQKETGSSNGNDKNINTENSYVGDQKCISCHSAEHEDWSDSHHYFAMLPANDTTVLGDFSGVTLDTDGIKSTFFRSDNSYYINTRGPDGDSHDYEIKYVFGYEPLQQYLVEFPGGKLQTTRQSWDTEQKKWFHQYPGENIAHHDWLDWTGGAQTWNTMCADCHSTNLDKNYDFTSDSYNTTWSSINVSCESCHGPGSMHVDLMMNTGDEEHSTDYNSHFVFGSSDTTNIQQVHSCAPCHSRRSFLGGKVLLTGNYFDNYIPQILRSPYYHPDGQVLEEDYVYGSFVQSKMYHNFVKCTDCHDPHSMKLKINGNLLCGQCHAPSYDSPGHHFHEQGTESAQCVSCHMPSKYYMGNDLRRDHSFRVPRPDQSLIYNTPNACNDCHNDKNAAWASDAINLWYGKNRQYHFSDDLLPGSLLDEKSERHLLLLLQKDSIPSIVKATALYYLGLMDVSSYSSVIAGFLIDDSPLVRKYALEALMNSNNSSWLSYALPLLKDETRIVRIGAYELLLSVSDQIPDEFAGAFNKAKGEYEAYLDHQLDFPAGRAAKGVYLHRLSDYSGARSYYESAIQKDSLVPGVRTNLSTVYSALGENSLAKKVLIEAVKIDPGNGNALYNLALLYNELNDIDSALYYFEKCVTIIDYNPRIYYNYGLLLEKTGQLKKAEEAFVSGLRIYPNSIDMNYAIAVFYLNNKEKEKAKPYIDKLIKLQPDNEDFKQLQQVLESI